MNALSYSARTDSRDGLGIKELCWLVRGTYMVDNLFIRIQFGILHLIG